MYFIKIACFAVCVVGSGHKKGPYASMMSKFTKDVAQKELDKFNKKKDEVTKMANHAAHDAIDEIGVAHIKLQDHSHEVSQLGAAVVHQAAHELGNEIIQTAIVGDAHAALNQLGAAVVRETANNLDVSPEEVILAASLAAVIAHDSHAALNQLETTVLQQVGADVVQHAVDELGSGDVQVARPDALLNQLGEVVLDKLAYDFEVEIGDVVHDPATVQVAVQDLAHFVATEAITESANLGLTVAEQLVQNESTTDRATVRSSPMLHV